MYIFWLKDVHLLVNCSLENQKVLLNQQKIPAEVKTTTFG